MTVVVPEAVTPASSTAFADFLDLRTAVIENVGRPDIADVFPRLLALAEARLAREVRVREQMATVTLNLVDGRALLPTDWLEVIGVFSATGMEYRQLATQANTQHTGTCFYSIEGGYLVGPTDSGEIRMDYYAKLPPLGTSVTTTNYLLQRYPDVYLYTTAFEAAKYVRDMEAAQINRDLMNEAIADMKADDQMARYARARVRVMGVAP